MHIVQCAQTSATGIISEFASNVCTLHTVSQGTQQPYAFWYCTFSFLCSSHRCSIFLILFCLSSICFSFLCAHFFLLFSLSSSVIRLPLARDYTSTEIMLYSINENYMDTDKRDDAFPQTHTNAGREIKWNIVEFDYLKEIPTLDSQVVRWTMISIVCMCLAWVEWDFQFYF